jgi:hypothetical protein
MRTDEQEKERNLYLKDLRRVKKEKGLCARTGCKEKVGKRLFGSPYSYCDEHRLYSREYAKS